MNNNRTKSNLKFLLFILVLCVFAFGGAMILNKDKNGVGNLLDDLLDNGIKDNYNGVYTYAEDLNGSKTLFEGCIASKINNHLVIVNDDYFVYRNSCVGTFPISNGKVKDLKIEVNEERQSYYIEYEGNMYFKNHSVTNVEVGNKYKDSSGDFVLSDYQLLLKESQYPDEYFDIKRKQIDGISSDIFIEFKHVKDEAFNINITGQKGSSYTYSFKDFDSTPEFYPYGAYVVVIEKDENATRYTNKLKVISEESIVYNLDNYFPILVDGVTLDLNNSIHVSFNAKSRNFRILIANGKQFCYENSDSKDIAYYEFYVDYNYATKSFEKPEFVKIGYKNEGCVYINEIMGG